MHTFLSVLRSKTRLQENIDMMDSGGHRPGSPAGLLCLQESRRCPGPTPTLGPAPLLPCRLVPGQERLWSKHAFHTLVTLNMLFSVQISHLPSLSTWQTTIYPQSPPSRDPQAGRPLGSCREDSLLLSPSPGESLGGGRCVPAAPSPCFVILHSMFCLR